MVKLTRIYTKGGDKGKTALGSGQRVVKHHPRVAAYGTVDETNAAAGLARLHTASLADPEADAILGRIQNDLFDLGADLATPEADNPEFPPLRIVAEQTGRLEAEIDRLNAELAPLNSFVLPGGSPAAAYLHLARTLARRAEREITALAESEAINPEAVRYINRLSDLFFVMSRYLNDKGAGDVLWEPGATRGGKQGANRQKS
ncbi:cob(I)yrinic acid a,c-diamide adenosyltransferase [Pelagibius marinus]|uniref:cob(I)yrinic acid a,c-diamide adenosyltransferase n=1 Tax=Pelagibius marinus TaxID=2762760 RepID=UPI001872DAB6|nr:cob(I)yrinic acid a,c-diamide adenosyltransferase [Pelagibius marinus]